MAPSQGRAPRTRFNPWSRPSVAGEGGRRGSGLLTSRCRQGERSARGTQRSLLAPSSSGKTRAPDDAPGGAKEEKQTQLKEHRSGGEGGEDRPRFLSLPAPSSSSCEGAAEAPHIREYQGRRSMRGFSGVSSRFVDA